MLERTTKTLCSLARALEVVGERWRSHHSLRGLRVRKVFSDFRPARLTSARCCSRPLKYWLEAGYGPTDQIPTLPGREVYDSRAAGGPRSLPRCNALTSWGKRYRGPAGIPRSSCMPRATRARRARRCPRCGVTPQRMTWLHRRALRPFRDEPVERRRLRHTHCSTLWWLGRSGLSELGRSSVTPLGVAERPRLKSTTEHSGGSRDLAKAQRYRTATARQRRNPMTGKADFNRGRVSTRVLRPMVAVMAITDPPTQAVRSMS